MILKIQKGKMLIILPFYLIFFILNNNTIASEQYYLIVPGTWNRPFDWYMPGSDFFDALTQKTNTNSVSFFMWSGKNSHAARMHAAYELASYFALQRTQHQKITVIAHSHGANVAILASQIIAQNNSINTYYIEHFYALGVPVHHSLYFPNMAVIKYFYNIFSHNDFIQPVFGLFKREYPSHPRIANIIVFINNVSPSHTELHHPLIGSWLPHLPSIVPFCNDNNTPPGILYFWQDKAPTYEVDTNRINKQIKKAIL